jgi:hypothetical protein
MKMKTLLAILKLVPAILTAIKALEEAIPIVGQGKAKLDLILDVIHTAYENASDLQDEFSWEKLSSIVAVIVGKIVAMFNALGIFKKS